MEKIVSWNKFELVVNKSGKSYANGGRLDKLWVEDRLSGRVFLIKGSSAHNYEPFSEKLAYIIGKHLGIEVLEYDIIPSSFFSGILDNGCGYVSICEKIDRVGYYITSVAEIKRAKNIILGFSGQSILNRKVMYDILPRSYIDTMLLFDAIIGNTDRHYGNVHILRNINGDMVGAPILDNGASLLANVSSFTASMVGWKVGEIFNKSLTIDKTHDRQMMHIKSIHNVSFNIPVITMNILLEIEPVLRLMHPIRAKAVEKYIVYRLRKYLGMIKYGENKQFKQIRQIKESEESIYS